MATAKDTKRTKGGLVYRGERFPGFNKPKRAPSSSKKKMRVLAKKGDQIKVVEFGQKVMDTIIPLKLVHPIWLEVRALEVRAVS